MWDDNDYRLLAYMQRAPAGNYTTAQLARTLGMEVAELHRRLTQLRRGGYLARSRATLDPAFHLTPRGRNGFGDGGGAIRNEHRATKDQHRRVTP